MASALSRLSEVSATRLMWSGRLSRPTQPGAPSGRSLNPNFVAVTTCPRNGSPEKRGHLLLVFGRTVRKAHSHAAEPESRNFQAALSKFALLHCFSFETVSLISRLESSALEAVS